MADATPMSQVRSVCDPTGVDREGLPDTDATGTRAPPPRTKVAQRGGDGHKFDWRVRPVHEDHLPRWQAAKAARQHVSIVAPMLRSTAAAYGPSTDLRSVGLVLDNHPECVVANLRIHVDVREPVVGLSNRQERSAQEPEDIRPTA
jgi:hypothetical protein